MIKNRFGSINSRKVIIEKYNKNKNVFGMYFCLPNTKKTSTLLVDFEILECKQTNFIIPNIDWHAISACDDAILKYLPFEINILSSIDNNSSEYFFRWIDRFSFENPYPGGAHIILFDLKTGFALSELHGCILESVSCKDGNISIIINFFNVT